MWQFSFIWQFSAEMIKQLEMDEPKKVNFKSSGCASSFQFQQGKYQCSVLMNFNLQPSGISLYDLPVFLEGWL